MADPSLPTSMRAWQFTSGKGGLEKNLKINESAPLPKRKADQDLVQVIAAALNPVDYKPAEISIVTRFFLSTPACPGIDVVGRVVQPADGSDLKPGQLVFGASGNTVIAGGALAGYAVMRQNAVAALPDGLDPIWGATVCIAGLTAYQSIVPYVKEGSSIFINGGSGGTGMFGIQFAKAKGCYVTTTCSTPNVDLCKSLGADEVIDYKKQNVVDTLKASGRKYDHVVDNVAQDPKLYWACHEYTKPKVKYVQIGGEISLEYIMQVLAIQLWPGFLGGGKRKHEIFVTTPSAEDLAQIGRWMKSGEVKPVIDSKFKFEDAPKAFEKLKTGRAKGKIVVEVNTEGL